MFVYALVDPRSGARRYVGQTVDLGRRLHGHLSRRDGSSRAEWIAGLREEGLKPVMVVLEEATAETASGVEQKWVDRLRREGCALFNAVAVVGDTRMVAFRLPEKDAAWLAAYAAARGVTKSVVIHEALRELRVRVEEGTFDAAR